MEITFRDWIALLCSSKFEDDNAIGELLPRKVDANREFPWATSLYKFYMNNRFKFNLDTLTNCVSNWIDICEYLQRRNVNRWNELDGRRYPLLYIEAISERFARKENFEELVKLIPPEEIMNDNSYWMDKPLIDSFLFGTWPQNKPTLLKLLSAMVHKGLRTFSDMTFMILLSSHGENVIKKMPNLTIRAENIVKLKTLVALVLKVTLKQKLGGYVHDLLDKCSSVYGDKIKLRIPDVLDVVLKLAIEDGVEEVDKVIDMLINKFKVDIFHLTLTQRAALIVRRVLTKQEMIELIKDVEFPEKIQNILRM